MRRKHSCNSWGRCTKTLSGSKLNRFWPTRAERQLMWTGQNCLWGRIGRVLHYVSFAGSCSINFMSHKVPVLTFLAALGIKMSMNKLLLVSSHIQQLSGFPAVLQTTKKTVCRWNNCIMVVWLSCKCGFLPGGKASLPSGQQFPCAVTLQPQWTYCLKRLPLEMSEKQRSSCNLANYELQTYFMCNNNVGNDWWPQKSCTPLVHRDIPLF